MDSAPTARQGEQYPDYDYPVPRTLEDLVAIRDGTGRWRRKNRDALNGMQTRSGTWTDASGRWTHRVRGKVVDLLLQYVPDSAGSDAERQVLDGLLDPDRRHGDSFELHGFQRDLDVLNALGDVVLRAREDAGQSGDREGAYYLSLYGGRALIHAREAAAEYGRPVSGSSNRDAAPRRVEFLTEVFRLIEEPLLEAGWSRLVLHVPRSARIELKLPDGHLLHPATFFSFRANPNAFRFRHIAHRLESFEHSSRVIAAVHERYGTRLAERLPAGTKLRWHVDAGDVQRNDQWQAEHPGGGYEDLAPTAAAEWAVAVGTTWLNLLHEDPPKGLLRVARPEGDSVDSTGSVPKDSSPRSDGNERSFQEKVYGVSVGEGPHRNWDDFRRYGFVSGGQNRWYSRTLHNLTVGDRIYAYIPRVGFVGTGIVTDEAVRIRDFTVVLDGRRIPLLDVPLRQPGIRENADDPERGEYCVAVAWDETRDRDEAFSEPGLRRNQNTAFKLTHEPTLRSLEKEFGVRRQIRHPDDPGS